MERPRFTEQQQKDLEDVYNDYLRDGILLVSYLGEPPQVVKDQNERWHRKVRERFGEDSEITKYLISITLVSC